MLKNPERVARFERDDTRERFGDMSLAEALALFEALWAHGATLGSEVRRDWRAGLESTFAIARAINGLPPKS